MAWQWIKRFPAKNVALVVASMLVVGGGIGGIMKVTVDRLLYWSATQVAETWAKYLIINVHDVAQIAAGELPSNESMHFFLHAQRVKQVFSFEIIDLNGYVQLVSDGSGIVNVGGTRFDPLAQRSAAQQHSIVEIREGEPPVRPLFYSVAYVPLNVDGKPRAVVAAYLDLSTESAFFRQQFIVAALALSIVVGIALGVPTFAWYRRTLEKRRADAHIRFLARHDALTGLVNRTTLSEAIGHRLKRGEKFALHYVDLDRFKNVNDLLGHDSGDELLKVTAARLVALSATNATVARLGGDEFAILQPNGPSKREAEALADAVVHAFAAPVTVNGHDAVVGASVGVALAPQDGTRVDRLIKSADLALYRSKLDGRGCFRFFSPEMELELDNRLALEQTIREAAKDHLFKLHYQPVFGMPAGELRGFEALLRLPDSAGNLISPSAFIPVVEEMGLIEVVGRWVIEEACRTATHWPAHLTVAVNLSAAQFSVGNVDMIVAQTLTSAGLAPHRLELEVTESLLLSDEDRVMAQLRKLKKIGVKIVMDDFGTGYSSLSYLWRFPFDRIKIDRSFMLGFDEETNRNAETVVTTIIALGRALNMQVTVEGVENQSQADFMRQFDREMVQGYFFGKPRPADEVAAVIAADVQRAVAKTSDAAMKMRAKQAS